MPTQSDNGRAERAEPTTLAGGPFPVDSYKEAERELRRPFTPQAVKFKVQATWNGGALIVPYIDARLVIERLNLACPHLWRDAPNGPGDATGYEATSGGLMWCRLTIDGITRGDVGEGIGKGLVSDAFKRAAVKFGVGVSLYAIPKMRVYENNGHIEQARDKDKYRLTAPGEAHCRALYERWLNDAGKYAFGDPLDHGDADESGGDHEAHGRARAGNGNGAPAPAQPQAQPAPEGNGEAEDPEAALEELLGKKSTLQDKRIEANEGMKRLGAKPQQRLRELHAAGTGRALDALIGRVSAVMDGAPAGDDDNGEGPDSSGEGSEDQ